MPQPPYTIRPALLADLASLHAFWDAMVNEEATTYPTYTMEDRQHWTMEMAMYLDRQRLGDPSVGIFIADDTYGVPVGFTSWTIAERPLGQPRYYWLWLHLYVLPSLRRQGIAGQLVRSMAMSMSLNDLPVELLSTPHDPQWERRGLEPIRTFYRTTTTAMLDRWKPTVPITRTDITPTGDLPDGPSL